MCVLLHTHLCAFLILLLIIFLSLLCMWHCVSEPSVRPSRYLSLSLSLLCAVCPPPPARLHILSTCTSVHSLVATYLTNYPEKRERETIGL